MGKKIAQAVAIGMGLLLVYVLAASLLFSYIDFFGVAITWLLISCICVLGLFTGYFTVSHVIDVVRRRDTDEDLMDEAEIEEILEVETERLRHTARMAAISPEKQPEQKKAAPPKQPKPKRVKTEKPVRQKKERAEKATKFSKPERDQQHTSLARGEEQLLADNKPGIELDFPIPVAQEQVLVTEEHQHENVFSALLQADMDEKRAAEAARIARAVQEEAELKKIEVEEQARVAREKRIADALRDEIEENQPEAAAVETEHQPDEARKEVERRLEWAIREAEEQAARAGAAVQEHELEEQAAASRRKEQAIESARRQAEAVATARRRAAMSAAQTQSFAPINTDTLPAFNSEIMETGEATGTVPPAAKTKPEVEDDIWGRMEITRSAAPVLSAENKPEGEQLDEEPTIVVPDLSSFVPEPEPEPDPPVDVKPYVPPTVPRWSPAKLPSAWKTEDKKKSLPGDMSYANKAASEKFLAEKVKRQEMADTLEEQPADAGTEEETVAALDETVSGIVHDKQPLNTKKAVEEEIVADTTSDAGPANVVKETEVDSGRRAAVPSEANDNEVPVQNKEKPGSDIPVAEVISASDFAEKTTSNFIKPIEIVKEEKPVAVTAKVVEPFVREKPVAMTAKASEPAMDDAQKAERPPVNETTEIAEVDNASKEISTEPVEINLQVENPVAMNEQPVMEGMEDSQAIPDAGQSRATETKGFVLKQTPSLPTEVSASEDSRDSSLPNEIMPEETSPERPSVEASEVSDSTVPATTDAGETPVVETEFEDIHLSTEVYVETVEEMADTHIVDVAKETENVVSESSERAVTGDTDHKEQPVSHSPLESIDVSETKLAFTQLASFATVEAHEEAKLLDDSLQVEGEPVVLEKATSLEDGILDGAYIEEHFELVDSIASAGKVNDTFFPLVLEPIQQTQDEHIRAKSQTASMPISIEKEPIPSGREVFVSDEKLDKAERLALQSVESDETAGYSPDKEGLAAAKPGLPIEEGTKQVKLKSSGDKKSTIIEGVAEKKSFDRKKNTASTHSSPTVSSVITEPLQDESALQAVEEPLVETLQAPVDTMSMNTRRLSSRVATPVPEEFDNSPSSIKVRDKIAEDENTIITSVEKSQKEMSEPRRSRGRPPKPKTEEELNAPKRPRGRPPKPKTEEELNAPKRPRGRPPKPKTEEELNAPKRPRGRPPKPKTEEELNAPKRPRGRPPKPKTEEELNAPKRPRGRPPKPKTEEELNAPRRPLGRPPQSPASGVGAVSTTRLPTRPVRPSSGGTTSKDK